MNTLFFIAAAIAIFSSIMVVSGRNAVHSLLFLILSLLSVAVTMYTSGAPFAAALEIIVYAGAIVILFVFVVMMLNLNKSPESEKASTGIKSWILPIILSLLLTADFLYAFLSQEMNNSLVIKVVDVKTVAVSMFTTYLLGAELAGMLLLAGIVGAYHLGRTPKRNLHRYLEN
jgi:NADH-quinone oxidoreductase subunit J